MDIKTININTAEYAVSKGAGIIETSSIGSCVVVCLYIEDLKIGGMAHCMLPCRYEDKKKPTISMHEERPAKYVDEAIRLMIHEIKMMGGDQKQMRAKIIGGAEMFKYLGKKSMSVGEENVNMAKKILGELNIPIVSEDTGGSVGRAANFNLENGVLNVLIRM